LLGESGESGESQAVFLAEGNSQGSCPEASDGGVEVLAEEAGEVWSSPGAGSI